MYKAGVGDLMVDEQDQSKPISETMAGTNPPQPTETPVPQISERSRKRHIYPYLIIALAIAIAAGLAYFYLSPSSLRTSTYTIDVSALRNVSPSNYSSPTIQSTTNPSIVYAPANITGLIAGYTTFISNSTLIHEDNVPLSAFAIVSVFNSTESAVRQYNYNYNITLRQHTVGGLNLTALTVPKIGNETAAFAIWPESTSTPENVKVFILIFRYNNTVARIGVYERINSTSPSAAISFAQQLLAKMRTQ